jgi:pentatricopeptide repeat protein
MRLVAHPTPSTEVYDAMIYGCSLDDRVSPERALDLFNEMLEAGITPSYNTYLGLIRSCARDKTKGDSPFYFESLRLLKELLERGFQPERDIFNCILEGARSRGDLARAKWIVANMVQIASRQLNPSESPLSPDGKIIQNLFLTAATFKIHDGASNMIKKNLLQDADTIPESVKVPDEDKQGIFLEADEAEEVKEDSPYVIEDRGPASEAGNRGDAHSHIPALHPLFRLQVPTSNEQLLEDCKVILGSILEVHGLPSGILESKMSGTEESGVLGNHDSRQTMTTTSSEPDYCDGLDDNVKAALLNVPIGNAVLNAYLTLLSSHDTSHSVYNFFRQGFSSLGVKYSYQSWEIMFGTLDASTKQKDQAVREWKCVVSDELFSEWQGWIEYILRNAKRPPAWMYRHIETVYARHMGVHARARQMDQAMDIIRDFVARFPPEHITPAVKSLSSMNSAGPDYLVKLSSALYPETMDTSFGGEHSAEYSSSNKKNIAIPRKSMPKSGLNSFNYFGIPPMLNYQMVYSTFHRFREEEDSRAVEILRLLHEYRMALDEAREIRKEMEIVSYKRGERSARREIIGLPGDKRMRFTVPKVSEALQEPTQEQEQERRADSLPDIEDGKLGDVRR